MLSVHRHYRSWNDKANERSAGRWVQDPLGLNQLTSRLRPRAPPARRSRPAWDLNSPVMYLESCALNTGRRIVTEREHAAVR